MTSNLAGRLRPWRRRVHRHRRSLAAALTFVAVLLGVGAVVPDDARVDPSSPTAPGTMRLPEGLVAAPVRIVDAEAAALVRAGDVVDVVAADGHGDAAVVASNVSVLAVPRPAEGLLGSGSGGGALVLVAVPSSTGVALAAAAAAGPLSLLLRS